MNKYEDFFSVVFPKATTSSNYYLIMAVSKDATIDNKLEYTHAFSHPDNIQVTQDNWHKEKMNLKIFKINEHGVEPIKNTTEGFNWPDHKYFAFEIIKGSTEQTSIFKIDEKKKYTAQYIAELNANIEEITAANVIKTAIEQAKLLLNKAAEEEKRIKEEEEAARIKASSSFINQISLDVTKNIVNRSLIDDAKQQANNLVKSAIKAAEEEAEKEKNNEILSIAIEQAKSLVQEAARIKTAEAEAARLKEEAAEEEAAEEEAAEEEAAEEEAAEEEAAEEEAAEEEAAEEEAAIKETSSSLINQIINNHNKLNYFHTSKTNTLYKGTKDLTDQTKQLNEKNARESEKRKEEEEKRLKEEEKRKAEEAVKKKRLKEFKKQILNELDRNIKEDEAAEVKQSFEKSVKVKDDAIMATQKNKKEILNERLKKIQKNKQTQLAEEEARRKQEEDHKKEQEAEEARLKEEARVKQEKEEARLKASKKIIIAAKKQANLLVQSSIKAAAHKAARTKIENQLQELLDVSNSEKVKDINVSGISGIYDGLYDETGLKDIRADSITTFINKLKTDTNLPENIINDLDTYLTPSTNVYTVSNRAPKDAKEFDLTFLIDEYKKITDLEEEITNELKLSQDESDDLLNNLKTHILMKSLRPDQVIKAYNEILNKLKDKGPESESEVVEDGIDQPKDMIYENFVSNIPSESPKIKNINQIINDVLKAYTPQTTPRNTQTTPRNTEPVKKQQTTNNRNSKKTTTIRKTAWPP